jgi:hypothetical protein
MTIMTREHPDWEVFCDRLGGPEGCHFHDEPDAEGKPQTRWRCAGGHDKSIATRLLHEMGLTASEIAASLAYFEARGGFCDCEILFNVAATDEP